MKTEDVIRAAFKYDPTTGVLTRRQSSGNVGAGSISGSADNRGYLRTYIGGKRYKNHRIAWLLYYGEWPTQQIDHINGDKQDNRIKNLRQCSTSENCVNQIGARKNNSIGLQGVHLIKRSGRFRSAFCGKHIGCFATAEEAHAAYMEVKQEHLP